MDADQFIAARIPAVTKLRLHTLALEQGLSDSAWLKRLIDAALDATSPAGVEAVAEPSPKPRQSRLYIRLYPDDRQLLRERAHARSLTPAAYVAVLVRHHIRHLTPIPPDEMQAFKRAAAELSALGRNLNQIARAMNEGRTAGQIDSHHSQLMLKICTALHDKFKSTLLTNERSWQAGYDVTKP